MPNKIIILKVQVNVDTELTDAQGIEVSNRTLELMPQLAAWLKQQLFLEFPYGKYEVTISQ